MIECYLKRLFRDLAPALVLGTAVAAGAADTATTQPATQPTVVAYPLTICLVSGEELGTMGDPILIVHEGQEFKFCCDHCVEPFRKDPAKYVAKLKAAVAATQPATE